MSLALDLNVLFAIFPPALEPFRVVELVDLRGVLVLMRLRGFDIWCIKRSPALSLRLVSSSASASRSSRAGNPAASAIAIVQRWRSSGISGKP